MVQENKGIDIAWSMDENVATYYYKYYSDREYFCFIIFKYHIIKSSIEPDFEHL